MFPYFPRPRRPASRRKAAGKASTCGGGQFVWARWGCANAAYPPREVFTIWRYGNASLGERFAGRRPVKKSRQKRPENRFRRHVRRKRRCSCAEAPLAKETIYSAKFACIVVQRERILEGASMAAKNLASLSAQAVECVRQPTCLAGRRHWGRICPQGKTPTQARPTLLVACAAIECAEPGRDRGKTDSRHRFASANCGIPLPPPGRSPRRSSERAPGG